jgi:hypothetical protein
MMRGYIICDLHHMFLQLSKYGRCDICSMRHASEFRNPKQISVVNPKEKSLQILGTDARIE